jgi:hypothetical protein
MTPELNHNPVFVAVVVAVLGFMIGVTKGGFNALGALLTPLLSLVLPVSLAVGVLLPMLIVGDAFAVYTYWRDWNAKSGEQGLYQLLAQRPDIDGIFVSNDQMALGVLHAAHRLGRRIPDDLSLVGVDNIPEAAHFWPPLTTVRQRLREAGAQAVQELDQMIQSQEDDAIPNIALLQPELVVRESSRSTGTKK